MDVHKAAFHGRGTKLLTVTFLWIFFPLLQYNTHKYLWVVTVLWRVSPLPERGVEGEKSGANLSAQTLIMGGGGVFFFLSCRGEKLVGHFLSPGLGISDTQPKSSPADWTFISSSKGFKIKKTNQTLWINVLVQFAGDLGLSAGEMRAIWRSDWKEQSVYMGKGREKERDHLEEGGGFNTSIYLFVCPGPCPPPSYPAIQWPSVLIKVPGWPLSAFVPLPGNKTPVKRLAYPNPGSLHSQLWSQLQSEPLGAAA